jgi:hypothetical protein
MPGDRTAPEDTFEIGLVMAGAVSAGAYTAGVIDFLFEALQALEDARISAAPGEFVPPLKVRLRAMSGTSAGAMVTAIVTTMLGTGAPAVTPESSPADRKAMTGNPLYDAWVQQIHWTKLLDNSDISRAGDRVLSALNSRPLDDIVGGVLGLALRNDAPRAFLSESVPVSLCVSNLRGVRYSLKFQDGDISTDHQMSLHADNMSFCYSRAGKASDGFIPLAPGDTPENWQILGRSALASGAFPIGIAARDLERDFSDYVKRRWFVAGIEDPPERRLVHGKPAEPCDDPASWRSRSGGFEYLPPVDTPADFPSGRYNFVNVDGGMFNNEPLEICRQALAGSDGHNPRAPTEASRAVILIDPFPNLFELDHDYNPAKERELMTVLKRLVSASISQARFKPDELALAKDPEVASRFEILPARYVSDKLLPYALACGALGGFSGFLSRAFRHHDYMLGRRNCQRFLDQHFMLPADKQQDAVNPLMRGWVDDPSPAARAAFEKYKSPGVITVAGAKRSVDHLPIVPLLGRLRDEDYTRVPPWPANPDDVSATALNDAILARADLLKQRLIEQYQPAWFFKLGIQSYWRLKRAEWVRRFAIDPVRQDLAKRGVRLTN